MKAKRKPKAKAKRKTKKKFPSRIIQRAFYSTGVFSARIAGRLRDQVTLENVSNGAKTVLSAPARFMEISTGKVTDPEQFVLLPPSAVAPIATPKEKAEEFLADLKGLAETMGQSFRSTTETIRVSANSKENKMPSQVQPIPQANAAQGARLVQLVPKKIESSPAGSVLGTQTGIPKKIAKEPTAYAQTSQSNASQPEGAAPKESPMMEQVQEGKPVNNRGALEPYTRLNVSIEELKIKLPELPDNKDVEQLKKRKEATLETLENQMLVIRDIMGKKKEMIENAGESLSIEPTELEKQFLTKVSSNIEVLSRRVDDIIHESKKILEDIKPVTVNPKVETTVKPNEKRTQTRQNKKPKQKTKRKALSQSKTKKRASPKRKRKK